MPRIARKNMTMPFFHLMTQGINKEYIFENNSEKVTYEKLILLQTEEFNVNILAYCIMDNHAHILIRVKEVENMSNFMHKINSQYATYYNKKHHRTGYVFKNRYKSQMINSLKHLYRCIDYIHDNPVKAGICNKAEEYPYSNYKMMKTEFKERYSLMTNSECNNEEYVFIDVDEKNETTGNKIIEAYLKENRIDLKSIKQSKELLKELILFLKDENKISLRKIAEELELSRETVRKIYNQ